MSNVWLEMEAEIEELKKEHRREIAELEAEVDSLRLTLIETQNELQAHNAIMTENGLEVERLTDIIHGILESYEYWQVDPYDREFDIEEQVKDFKACLPVTLKEVKT